MFFDDDTSGSIPLAHRPAARLLLVAVQAALAADGSPTIIVTKMDRLATAQRALVTGDQNGGNHLQPEQWNTAYEFGQVWWACRYPPLGHGTWPEKLGEPVGRRDGLENANQKGFRSCDVQFSSQKIAILAVCDHVVYVQAKKQKMKNACITVATLRRAIIALRHHIGQLDLNF